MIHFLGTPRNQLQAYFATGMPVLVSFAARSSWLDRSWMHAFEPLLLDSGAFSELNSGIKVDLHEYVEWAQSWPHAIAWAGLDDIAGDWRRSLRNYQVGGFPTFHDSDPDELLDELVDLARERDGWLGIGLMPPRRGRRCWLERTLERIPDEIHVHGWACGSYSSVGFDSIDSTNWTRDIQAMLTRSPFTSHLTPGECLEIIVKRYQRAHRTRSTAAGEPTLFDPNCSGTARTPSGGVSGISDSGESTEGSE